MPAAAKLAAYGVVLAVMLGGGALVGATIGPDESGDGADEHGVEAMGDELPDGLAVSRDGYTLDLLTRTVAAGAETGLELVIEGPDGRPVTEYSVEHDKQLHLVIVGRDLIGYAHVHPTRDDAGIWRVTVPALTPGSYRVFADFTPAGHDGLTLGADLAVPGEYQPAPLPAASAEARVDGYDVAFEGELIAGTESALALTVSHDGEPVTDLEPYLGALGHLVAIRTGDLAYLHVHPLEETDGPGGPLVKFAVEVPSDGEYRLFFDFSHDGEVRTAAVTVSADAPATSDDDRGGGHDAEHGG